MIKPKFRENTLDEDIFKNIVEENEYNINDLTGVNVIDIGGHIGSFSYFSLLKNAKSVITVEAFEENFNIFKEWSGTFENVKGYNLAAWHKSGEVLNFAKQEEGNTGAGSVMINTEESDIKVTTIGIDELIKEAKEKGGKVLLKLDCEGSEFPILYSCERLKNVDFICGEFHEFNDIPDYAKYDNHKTYSSIDLEYHLRINGFTTKFEDVGQWRTKGGGMIGYFWAWKTDETVFDFLL